MFELAGAMSKSHRALLEQIERMVQALSQHGGTKPSPGQFTIKRDKKGLIETIDFVPRESE